MTLCLRKSNFFGCSCRPAVRSGWKTRPRLAKCSGNVSPSMITSSRYTKHFDHCSPARTRSIRSWKVAGALVSPKGMTLNSNRLSDVQKAVLGQSSSATSTCQYPLRRSMVENHFEPEKVLECRQSEGVGKHLCSLPR